MDLVVNLLILASLGSNLLTRSNHDGLELRLILDLTGIPSHGTFFVRFGELLPVPDNFQ